jgi:multicomponent Na+:H+ antiporter subunit D
MEAVVSIKPLLAVLISLGAAGLILASGKNPNLRECWSLTAAAAKFLIVASMIPVVFNGQSIEYKVLTFFPGVDLKFKVDSLGLMFGLTASFLWILTTLYSIGYMRSLNEHAQTRYFACFAVTLSATMGVAFAANLFTLFLFYEVITLVTYPLVSHYETPEAYSAGRKYLVYLLGTSKTFLLAAILLTYSIAGTLDFNSRGIFSDGNPSFLLVVIYILFIAGFAKAGIMPFHSWLPSAMVAPTPVSALLHAVAVVKVGVFSILRVIFDVMGPDLMERLNLGIPTALFVSVTILTASLIAMAQDNLKMRLAYSTVSQLSYVVLGAALLTPSGMTGGMLHIINHAFSKITLFFCAGAIYVASHKKHISEMHGISKKMPWTMLAFSIGALSMIGMPPTAGLISKWYLAVGSIQANEVPILIVLLSSTLLNAAYFLPIIYTAYFREPKKEGHDQAGYSDHPPQHAGHGEAPWVMVVPLLLTAAGTLFLGLYPNYFLDLVREMIPK